MSFIAPGQLLRMQDEEADYSGMTLHIHPDFLRTYALNSGIKQYGFFSYSAAEALYLSEKEKATILSIYSFIQEELSERIDKFSQDVIISQINTQQFIHEKVIEKAKEYLAKDELTITEVAYHLGFEHPQSFNKLFKSKTTFSPSDYKMSLLN